MKKFYIIGASVVFLFILIISLPQMGASCSWRAPLSPTLPTFVLLQVAGLGAILGGLLTMIWKSRKDEGDSEGGEGGDA